MKRIIIAASVVTAVAAGGYWVSQQPNNGFTNSYDVLAYVPANTVLFSGQLEPFPIRSYLNSVADTYKNTSDEMIEEFYSASEYDPEDKRMKFFISLTKSYMDSMESADKFIATMGVAEQMRGYVYTLGMVPVLKLEVAKPEAIWALLDKAELDSGLSHEQRQLKELTYRAYTLSEPDDEETVELVFAQQNNFLTVTFNTSLNETALLETAFGLSPVEESLASTNMIEDIIKTHSFSDNSIGYINHQAIVNALTAPNESLLGKQIAKLLAKQNDKSLQVLQTPACQTELPAIAANWPRTVFGMNSLSITDSESTFDMSMVVESHNNAILSALKQLTGFIPSYVKDIDNTVFAMGIGLDVAQVSPAINAIWNDLQQPSYQCEPLQQMQQSISQQNPAMLGMIASMANGVKGLGFSVLDYSLDETKTEPALKDLDALVSLSADDPRALFNMLATFKPELAQIKLPENNTVVALSSLMPLPLVPGVNAKLLITDDHMIIFTGDKAEKTAQNLSKVPLVNNGIYNLSLDYSKAFTPIVSMAEMSGQVLPDEVAAFKDYDVRLNTGLGINEQGIVVHSYINAKAAPTAIADAK
ncbi:MAG: hypothetical protein ACI86X_001864 [Moritella sp.]|jgi:hypothetical protein